MNVVKSSLISVNAGALILGGVVIFGVAIALPVILMLFNQTSLIPTDNPLNSMMGGRLNSQKSKFVLFYLLKTFLHKTVFTWTLFLHFFFAFFPLASLSPFPFLPPFGSLSFFGSAKSLGSYCASQHTLFGFFLNLHQFLQCCQFSQFFFLDPLYPWNFDVFVPPPVYLRLNDNFLTCSGSLIVHERVNRSVTHKFVVEISKVSLECLH